MAYQAELAQVVSATDACGTGFRIRERRHEHPGQDGDDGDYHGQLDQSKCWRRNLPSRAVSEIKSSEHDDPQVS
jgi:hypothetical protein